MCVPLFFVYKAKKENDLNPILLEKGFLSVFFGTKCIYTCCCGIRDFWRTKTCVSMKKRKKIGEIMGKKGIKKKEKKGKKRKKKEK